MHRRSPAREEDGVKKTKLEATLQTGVEPPDLGPIEDHLYAVGNADALPGLAIFNCVARIDEASPALLAVLARAADGEALALHEQRLVFRGLHILAGARVNQAWPPLLRLLRRPVGEVEDLLGEAVSDFLPRIVVGVFDGDAEALFGAISDRSLDEFIRHALLGAATFLTWEGGIDLDRLRNFLQRFHDEHLADDLDYVWIGWLDAIALLGQRDLAPLVRDAWRDGRIIPEILDESDFEKSLLDAERAPNDIERFERANLGHIADVIEALEGFTWNGIEDPDDLADEEEFARDALPPPNVPVINPLRHVGRNDPCPCGSGKQFKKCCLAD